MKVTEVIEMFYFFNNFSIGVNITISIYIMPDYNHGTFLRGLFFRASCWGLLFYAKFEYIEVLLHDKRCLLGGSLPDTRYHGRENKNNKK